MNFTHKCAIHKAVSHWFCRWRFQAQHADKFRRIIDNAKPNEKRQRKGMEQIFRNWKDHMFRVKIKNLEMYITTSVGWAEAQQEIPKRNLPR